MTKWSLYTYWSDFREIWYVISDIIKILQRYLQIMYFWSLIVILCTVFVGPFFVVPSLVGRGSCYGDVSDFSIGQSVCS